MPAYDYKCDNCGYQYEVFQSMKDKLLKKCPECGENKLRRLIGGGGGLIFKGSGFYLTDYKNNKSSEASKTSADTSGKSKTEKKDTSSEKPASGSKAKKSAPAKEK